MGFFDQFTPEQMKAGYERSAAGIKILIDKAAKKGVDKINGFTVVYLQERYEFYLQKAKEVCQ